MSSSQTTKAGHHFFYSLLVINKIVTQYDITSEEEEMRIQLVQEILFLPSVPQFEVPECPSRNSSQAHQEKCHTQANSRT